MVDDARPRPIVGSRHPTGRPRKIAGRRPDRDEAVMAEQPQEPQQPQPPRRPAGRLAGLRTTTALVAALVLLIGVGAFEVLYLTDGGSTPSAARPVVTGELAHRAAVEAAAGSTEEILSTSYENYDEQVEQATSKMTDTFAEQYRQTSDGIRDRFLARRTELQVEAVAQGVVRASSEEVQALLFLNQYVQKQDAEGRPQTDYAQYRALVTVTRSDAGWLVSDIETD